MAKTRQYEYVWSVAYRVTHWVFTAVLAVLTFTGFYIYGTFLPAAGDQEFALMAWMRFSHFVAAYVLILALAVRIYLAFWSTFDANWREFRVIRNIKNSPDIVRYYLFLTEEHKEYKRYNPLQALTYLFWAFLVIFMAITGFALYDGTLFGVVSAKSVFGWVNTLLGGRSHTRICHYLGMWVFLITIAVHIYMAISQTIIQRDHTLHSMFTGYKLKTNWNNKTKAV